MFVASKIFWAFAQPLSLLVLLALAALLLSWHRPRLSRALLAASCALWLLMFFTPMERWVLGPLEQRFPSPVLPEHVDGIIVLGGAVQAAMSREHGQTVLGDAAERMTAGAMLARRYPQARLLFSGGSGAISEKKFPEAEAVTEFWEGLGVDHSRIVLEGRSRNTYENALFSHQDIQPRPGETWLLVTSALHMPRSVGCFRQVGWQVVPYPVDYRTSAWMGWLEFDFPGALSNLTYGSKEWVGLLAYHLAGRTDELFPAP